MNKASRAYLAAVRKALHCPPDAKSSILNNLTADLQDYLQENPEATYEAINRRFGSPEDYALESISLMDVKVLNAELKARKRVLRIAIVCCVVTLALVIAGVLYSAHVAREIRDTINGYSATEIEIR